VPRYSARPSPRHRFPIRRFPYDPRNNFAKKDTQLQKCLATLPFPRRGTHLQIAENSGPSLQKRHHSPLPFLPSRARPEIAADAGAPPRRSAAPRSDRSVARTPASPSPSPRRRLAAATPYRRRNHPRRARCPAAAFGPRRRRSGDQSVATRPLLATPCPGASGEPTQAPHLAVPPPRHAPRRCGSASPVHC
jgi:hypothetical protein